MGCEVSQQNANNAQLPNHRYEEKELIATGTYSKVYKVRDKINNKEQAKKVIEKMPENYKIEQIRPDFPQYFSKLTSLKHQNLISYKDIYFTQGQLQIVMDYSLKGTLLDYIRSKGKLNQAESAEIIKKVLEGLYYLHNQDLLHNDLKPSNILLFQNNQPKISDFCISELFDTRLGPNDKGKKFTSTKWDNIPYMAPEIVKNLGATTLSDVWSVGCILIEMFTGKKPWTNFGSQDQVFKKVASGVVPPLPSQISPTCSNFLQACLAIVPSQRLRVDELLSHPFLTATRQNNVLVSSKKNSFTISKKIKTQTSQPKQQKSIVMIDTIQQLQSPIVWNKKSLRNSIKKSRTLIPSENKSINISNLKEQKSKAKYQVEYSSPQEHEEANTIILNNRIVKMSKQLYKQSNPQRFSTDTTEWTSPSRVKIKNIKEGKSQIQPKNQKDQIDILLANNSGVIDSTSYFMPEIPQKELSRMRIKTQNNAQFDKQYYKKPLQLLKQKIQERRAFQNFQERMQTELRKQSAVNETNNRYLDSSERGSQHFHQYSNSNREEIVIDTEVARLERDHYQKSHKFMMQKRKQQRLKWQSELKSGREMLKQQLPFRYYLK